jgi:hypothetical protein
MLTPKRHIEAAKLRGRLKDARDDLASVEANLDDDEPVPHEDRLNLRRRVVGDLEAQARAMGIK